MRYKFLTSIALITVLVGVALAWRGTIVKRQSRRPATIRVIITQLPTEDGTTSIEITQPTVSSSVPHKLEEFTYIIRNNSAKSLSAIAVIKTITYEEGGQIYTTSLYSMMDYYFHPDLDSGKLLQPGGEATMESGGPLSFNEGAVIKEISLKLDYVSYHDNTAYGQGGEGARRINSMRAGAREYKNWLRQKYSRDGKSLTTILPLMQTRTVPEELKLGIDQALGADRYRLHLLETVRTKGERKVEEYFKQNH